MTEDAQNPTAESLLNADGEVVVTLADGWTLRSGVYNPQEPDALTSGEYVRLCYPNGLEYGYWDQEEWRTDPALVMGAIINSAAGLRFDDNPHGRCVIASNGFVVWAPDLDPDPTRPDCPRHSAGDPDDTCTCPEAAEFEPEPETAEEALTTDGTQEDLVLGENWLHTPKAHNVPGTYPPAYRGTCSCGWVGETVFSTRHALTDALEAARDHVEAETGVRPNATQKANDCQRWHPGSQR